MRPRKETVTALLFLLAMGAVLVWLAFPFLTGNSALRTALGALRRDPASFPAFVSEAEGDLNDDLDRAHGFIQLYGGFQQLTGRRVLEDVDQSARVVKLSDGALNFSYPHAEPLDTAPLAEAVEDLNDALAAEGIPLLYAAAPQKLQQGREAELLPPGIHDYANDNADRLLAALRDHGTDTLDLRSLFDGRSDYADLFFRTDHHWKPEAAFLAWQELARVLDADYGISTDPLYTDEGNYDKTVYEDIFLGSQGKRTGSLYAGVDSITEYVPRFDTDFTYSSASFQVPRTGPFGRSLLFPERVAERDWFNGNPYTLYAGGDYALAAIDNGLHPNGKKILLLRESFSCALTPFLALSCDQLTTVDLRQFQGDLMDTIRDVDPDLVVVLYCVSSLRNSALFSFGQGAS